MRKVNAEVVEGDLQVYAEFVDRDDDDDDDGKIMYNNIRTITTNFQNGVRFPNCLQKWMLTDYIFRQ